MENNQRVYAYLSNLEIEYESIKHGPMFHSNDLAEEFKDIDVLDIKNLFFRGPKGKNHYLIIMPYLKERTIKEISVITGEKRLSFASEERLMKHLGVTTGAVSVFNLLNNDDHAVKVYIDEEIFESNRVGFHPNINTETLIFSSEDFKRIVETLENEIHILNL
jgi:Ala-tRNA(Pro) deacylase